MTVFKPNACLREYKPAAVFTIKWLRQAMAMCKCALYVSQVFSAELKLALPFFFFFFFLVPPISFPCRQFFLSAVNFSTTEICIFWTILMPDSLSSLCVHTPVYLNELLTVYKPTLQLHSLLILSFSVFSVCTHLLGQRSFYYAARSVWNSLPFQIRSSNTLTSF